MRLIKCLICTRLKFDFCFHFSFFSLSPSLSLLPVDATLIYVLQISVISKRFLEKNTDFA